MTRHTYTCTNGPTYKHTKIKVTDTSISSLFGKRGAIIMFFSKNPSESTSNVCPVIWARRSQWRFIMALLDIISSSGQHSLKSSIFFFRSRNACHSFKALGSLRHLNIKNKKGMSTSDKSSTLINQAGWAITLSSVMIHIPMINRRPLFLSKLNSEANLIFCSLTQNYPQTTLKNRHLMQLETFSLNLRRRATVFITDLDNTLDLEL